MHEPWLALWLIRRRISSYSLLTARGFMLLNAGVHLVADTREGLIAA